VLKQHSVGEGESELGADFVSRVAEKPLWVMNLFPMNDDPSPSIEINEFQCYRG
jgi:hypothetical protein